MKTKEELKQAIADKLAELWALEEELEKQEKQT